MTVLWTILVISKGVLNMGMRTVVFIIGMVCFVISTANYFATDLSKVLDVNNPLFIIMIGMLAFTAWYSHKL